MKFLGEIRNGNAKIIKKKKKICLYFEILKPNSNKMGETKLLIRFRGENTKTLVWWYGHGGMVVWTWWYGGMDMVVWTWWYGHGGMVVWCAI